MYCAIILTLILLMIVYLWRREGYRSCQDCDDYRMDRRGTAVINPYIWPYSGTDCVDDLYIANASKKLDINFSTAPLTHLNTPDHVELIN